jgi:hypothetical protein
MNIIKQNLKIKTSRNRKHLLILTIYMSNDSLKVNQHADNRKEKNIFLHVRQTVSLWTFIWKLQCLEENGEKQCNMINN